NHWCEQAEQREAGHGAFLLRREADDNPLPFVPVAAQGRRERWQVQGIDQPALTCWTLLNDDGSDVSRGSYVQGMAQACATEVVRLLRLGQQGQAGFAREGNELQTLHP